MPIQLLRDALTSVRSTLRSILFSFHDSADTGTEDSNIPENDTPPVDTDQASPQQDDLSYSEQAAQVSNAIIDAFTPETALHIGCGTGHHMKPFLDAGIDTHGVDPSSVALEDPVVPEDRIEIYDLGYPYTPDNEYDLVVCLDTLEYVAERHADIIIQSISTSGARAVISIPIAPHRPDPDTWINKFTAHDMQFDEPTTTRLESQLPTSNQVWAPDKILVFRQQ